MTCRNMGRYLRETYSTVRIWLDSTTSRSHSTHTSERQLRLTYSTKGKRNAPPCESLTPVATEFEVGKLLHQRGWRTAFTVSGMVTAWAALVSTIEHGYDDDIYEYTNDLYCRNWLHEAWILLDEHIIQLRTPQIKALDDRYKAATVDDDGQALS